MENQPYQTPESDVRPKAVTTGQYGSIEKALAGDYEFEIGTVLSESWEKVKGIKGSVILGGIIVYALVFGVNFLAGLLAGDSFILSFILSTAASVIFTPMYAGLAMIGIKRSVDQDYSFTMIFNYFGFLGALIICNILSYIFIGIGMILLILPGIYLMVAYTFSTPLIIEKEMGVWEAMETSRKSVTKRWFTFFLLGILYFVILIVSMIPVGIGLIWTLPLGVSMIGVLYRNMFGVETEPTSVKETVTMTTPLEQEETTEAVEPVVND